MDVTAEVTLPRLFADTQGRSHFGDVRIPTVPKDFAPPAPPMYVSEPVEAKRTVFLVLPVGWHSEPHPAPERQLMVFVKGTIEVTASDGERRSFKPGDFCLVEDTSGDGHTTENQASEPAVISVTQY